VTLRELLALYTDQFYQQTWYSDEPFLDVASPKLITLYALSQLAGAPLSDAGLPLAVQLAQAYLREPRLGLWKHYLWCADTDRQGQRIYVGSNGKGFEIHRHLHLTNRWGVPLWR
jgi:hypothetical protein